MPNPYGWYVSDSGQLVKPDPVAAKPATSSLPAMNYSAAFGGIPTLPSPVATAKDAITGNIANLSDIYKLTGDVNVFNQAQAAGGLQANLPNYAAMTGAASQNILNNLRGQISPDVMNVIQQAAAERGIASGVPGSPNANAAMLRALGLTSMDLQNMGQSQLSQAVARTPTAQPMLPQSMMVSPEAMQDVAASQSIYNAAPTPSARAAADLAALGAGGSLGRSATSPIVPSYASLIGRPAYGQPTDQDSASQFSGPGSWMPDGSYMDIDGTVYGADQMQNYLTPATEPMDSGYYPDPYSDWYGGGDTSSDWWGDFQDAGLY